MSYFPSQSELLVAHKRSPKKVRMAARVTHIFGVMRKYSVLVMIDEMDTLLPGCPRKMLYLLVARRVASPPPSSAGMTFFLSWGGRLESR